MNTHHKTAVPFYATDPWVQQVVDILDWRVYGVAGVRKIGNGRGLELVWELDEGRALIISLWPELKAVSWFVHGGAESGSDLVSLGSAPFPPREEIERKMRALGRGGRGRKRYTVGGFMKDMKYENKCLGDLVVLWVDGGKEEPTHNTRHIYQGRLRRLMKSTARGFGERMDGTLSERLWEAMPKVPASYVTLCERFIRDVEKLEGRSQTPEREKGPEASRGRKLREEDVKVIFELLADRKTDAEIAERFGVSTSLVNSIRLGQTWRRLHPSRKYPNADPGAIYTWFPHPEKDE